MAKPTSFRCIDVVLDNGGKEVDGEREGGWRDVRQGDIGEVGSFWDDKEK